MWLIRPGIPWSLWEKGNYKRDGLIELNWIEWNGVYLFYVIQQACFVCFLFRMSSHLEITVPVDWALNTNN